MPRKAMAHNKQVNISVVCVAQAFGQLQNWHEMSNKGLKDRIEHTFSIGNDDI